MMTEDFRISVVIPAFNEAPRIVRSVQSVLNQTYPVNEIIVVDDGSTDNTAEVVSRFQEKVRCISQSNQGLSAARNTGISNAKFEWIAFLDADDEWFSSHIENAKNILDCHPEIMWYCAAFERRREDGITEYISRLDDTMRNDSIINDYFITEAKTSFSKPSAMIVKREVFDQAGLFNLEIGSHGEDLDMWYRIALRYPQIAYSPEPGCIYWQRAGSITSSNMNDIPRFLKRIKISKSAGKNYLGNKRNMSADLLIGHWVQNAIKMSIKQKEPQNIGLIESEFSDYLSGPWKIMLKFLKYRIVLDFIQFGLKLKSSAKGKSQ